MTPRGLAASACVAALSVAALGAWPRAQTPRPIPAGAAAFNTAVNIRNPDRRIEALQNLLADPQVGAEPGTVRLIHQALVNVLAKYHPERAGAIEEYARSALSQTSSSATNRVLETLTVVRPLCEAGILAKFGEATAIDALSAGARTAARQSPLYFQLQACLGRFQVLQGHLDDAETNLEAVLAVRAAEPIALLAKAELLQQRGERETALATFIQAAAVQRIPPAAQKQMGSLYAATHNGSTAGLEELIDQQYRELKPASIEVTPYKGTPRRTVLIEEFTSAGSPLLADRDRMMESVMERYRPAGIAFLMYHTHWGEPDPLSNPDAQAHARAYQLPTTPATFVDGTRVFPSEGSLRVMPDPYARIVEAADKQLKLPAEISMTLDAQLSGRSVRLSATVGKYTKPVPDLQLVLVLAEEQVRYMGESGIRLHPMVVRSVTEIGLVQGTTVVGPNPLTQTVTLDLDTISAGLKRYLDQYEASNGVQFLEKKHEIDPNRLVAVAFVQSARDRTVLQAAMATVKAGRD